MIKKKKNAVNKKVIILAAFALILLLIVFGTKIYLYLNLLMGNDLIILLDANKQNFFIEHEDADNIKIKMSSITNPFCTAICSSEFIDLSNNNIIENDNFQLKTSSISKDFEIYPETKGKGQRLYRFSIQCSNVKTYLCNTKENVKTKNILFTVDYDLNDYEKKVKENSGEKIKFTGENIGGMIYKLNEINKTFYELNNIIILDNFAKEIGKNRKNLDEVYNKTLMLKQLWEDEEYYKLEGITYDAEISFYDAKHNFDYIKYSFLNNLSFYNNMAENLTEIMKELKSLNKIKVSLITYTQINKLNDEFNNLTVNFSKRDYINNKYDSLNSFATDLGIVSEMIKNDVNNGIDLDYSINLTLNELNLTKIELNISENNFNFDLEEPQPICCALGKCRKCCDDECKNDESKFPAVLVHGHSFNEKISAEYSLDIFSSIQKKLESDGYINAGSFYSANNDNPSKGILGRIRNPLSFKVSYYFDALNNNDQNIIIETKADNIDTYAIRLNEIIKSIKHKTNREKVIIIAHSMGGLVLRRYIQIFGSDSLDKVILIGTPNYGINDKILRICNLFGTEVECRDMSRDSLFINKLGSMSKPDVPFYNIIGVGCEMDNEDGDGIVENKSAYLEYARNYYIKGACNGIKLDFLHNDLVNINKYPEVYDIINKIFIPD